MRWFVIRDTYVVEGCWINIINFGVRGFVDFKGLIIFLVFIRNSL